MPGSRPLRPLKLVRRLYELTVDRGLVPQDSRLVRALLGRVALLELSGPVVPRALEPFPVPVRTLDALHLASLEFLKSHGQPVQLASYDERLLTAARRLAIEVYTL
jgi:hypothetical protein